GRDFALAVLAPAEYQDRNRDGEETEDHDPPDVPDQGKAGERRKESDDKADRTVARHLDGLIDLLGGGQTFPLHFPKGVDRLDPGQHREVIGRRRRRWRPFELSTIPRIASQVEADFARADADIELRDLAEDAKENDDGARFRDQQ